MQRSNGSTEHGNAGLFWPVLCLIASVDFGTKYLAAKRLLPQGLPHEVFGDWIRFTLVRNPGAAFGLHLGSQSRWIFMALTIVALVILGFLYTSTRRGDAVRSIALAMVCGGAVGNLIDRITSRYGVVDFEYRTADDRQTSKIIFVYWCPDQSRIREKMTYSSSKDALKNKLQGIHPKALEASDPTELESGNLRDRLGL